MKRFSIVVPKPDAGVELYAMKAWLRQNPEFIPTGMDATSSTSHQLRNGLRRLGWSVQETPSEVRLIPSGASVADVDAVLGDNVDLDESESAEASFGLEHQLRDFIAQNISAIDVHGKRLQLFVDASGRDGIEYPTSVGSIDILAIDRIGNFYVFELKRARSPDSAIGQLARYMGWVKAAIAKGRNVNGIIVAREIGDKLRYGVSVVPNVDLFEYTVEFQLKLSNEIA